MAKRTLENILQCPIDFIYLWATDDFIAQLGSKSKIIKKKKYNQYQTLWKTMVENTSASSQEEYINVYNSWVERIGEAITDVYGMTPVTILKKLALGKEVLGKNWSQGIYGVGEVQTSFTQNTNVTVNADNGMIMIDGVAVQEQIPTYGKDGVITGYSYYDKSSNAQYQSGITSSGKYGALSYSTVNGAQSPTGEAFDASKGSFWQNANNYIPLFDKIISWIMSLLGSFSTSTKREVLTNENTAPKQSEWVEESNNNGLLLGGLALGGLLMFTSKPKGKKRSKNK